MLRSHDRPARLDLYLQRLAGSEPCKTARHEIRVRTPPGGKVTRQEVNGTPILPGLVVVRLSPIVERVACPKQRCCRLLLKM
jgi:hypothetical protein